MTAPTPEHAHEFSVDTTCDCGMVLSAYVRRIVKERAALCKALETIHAIACGNRSDDYESDTDAASDIEMIARAALAQARGES